jgi:hypothetical protein
MDHTLIVFAIIHGILNKLALLHILLQIDVFLIHVGVFRSLVKGVVNTHLFLFEL